MSHKTRLGLLTQTQSSIEDLSLCQNGRRSSESISLHHLSLSFSPMPNMMPLLALSRHRVTLGQITDPFSLSIDFRTCSECIRGCHEVK